MGRLGGGPRVSGEGGGYHNSANGNYYLAFIYKSGLHNMIVSYNVPL